jgi:RNA polymerase sigma-70 factor (ECF subfamily)
MANNSLLNESELLAKIAEGDQRAFKIVYDRYRPQVYTFSLKYLKSTVQAEEVVQEIFLKIWRLKERLLEINDIESFILTIARNKSFDLLRKMKLEAKYMAEIDSGIEMQSNAT